LDGRVKTLNPYIHGGLLYRRDREEDLETIEKMEIGPIDMLVNNLYPIEETVAKDQVGQDEIRENIDIGGPSMIRAAAKNYKFVSCLVDPKDYPRVVEELRAEGQVSLATREYLAAKVFNYTAYYDGLIAKYFNKIQKNQFPDRLSLVYKKKDKLR